MEGNMPEDGSHIIYDRLIGEIDETIPYPTFCLIRLKLGKTWVYRFNSHRSLFLFGPGNWLRQKCILLTTSIYFETSLLFVLLVHMVTAFNTSSPQTGAFIETVLIGFYTLECCLRIIARGFIIGPYTFTREALNTIDFGYITLSLGLLYFSPFEAASAESSSSSFIYLRFFHILDLLCLFSRFRIVLLTLVRACQNIAVVVGAIAGLIFIYANIGLKSFKGTLSRYCRLNAEMDILPAHLVPGRRDYFLNLERRTVPCRNSITDCPPNYMCLRERERDRLYFTFDNIFYSALNILRVIILDDFEDVYEKLLDVQPAVAVVSFFGPIIFFGSLVLYSTLLNVVITTSYDLELKIEADITSETGLYGKVIKLTLNTFSSKFVFVFSACSKKIKYRPFSQRSLHGSKDKKIWKSYWSTAKTTKRPNKWRGGGESGRGFGKTLNFINVRTAGEDLNGEDDPVTVQNTPRNSKKLKPIEPGGNLFECDRKRSFLTRDWIPPLSAEEEEEAKFDPYDDFWDLIVRDATMTKATHSKYRSIISDITTDPRYNLFVDLCMTLNVLILCSDHHNQPDWLESLQLYSDIVFTTIFTVELGLRIAINRKIEGLLDTWEILLNFLGWVEVVIFVGKFTFYHLDIEIFTMMAVIRSLKITRALRLPYIRKLSMKLGDFMITIIVYFVILSIIIYVWSVIGYHLFRNYYRSLDSLENPFYGISRALVINIMILCGQIYKPIQQCLAETTSPASFCMIYFLGGVPIFSVMIFLFEGILFHSMATTIKVNQPLFEVTELKNKIRFIRTTVARIIQKLLIKIDTNFLALDLEVYADDYRSRFDGMFKYLTPLELISIVTSGTILLFDDIFALNSTYRNWIFNVSEFLVVGHAMGEIITQVLILGTRKTLSSPLFLLKIVLSTSILVTYINFVDRLHMQKLRRLLIFSRALVIFTHVEAVVVTYKTMIRTLTALFNSILLCFVIWLIFASVGVSLLKGMGYECLKNEREVNLNKTMCEAKGFEWRRRYANFDNVALALDALKFLTIYQDMEGIVMAGIRSQGIGLGVKGKPRLGVTVFYMLFLIGGSYFLFSLFIGVIFDTFKGMEMERKENISDILTPSKSLYWVERIKKLFDLSLMQIIKKPKDDILRVFYKINLSTEYQTYCHIIVILNAIFMAFDSYELTQQGENLHKASDLIFFTLFGMEFIVKVLGQRTCYFLQFSNLLNLAAIITMLLSSLGIGPHTNAYIYHLTLVGRMLEASRIFEMFPKVYKIIKVIVSALPSLVTVTSVHWILILLYASVGTFYFHDDVSQTAKFNVHHFNFKTLTHSVSVLILLTTKTKVHDIERSLHDPGNEAGWINMGPPVLYDTGPTGTTTKSHATTVVYMGKHHNMSPNAVSFYITSFMVFNLVASMLYQAIMAEYFVYANDEDDDQSCDRPVRGEDVDLFLVLWDDLTDGRPYMKLGQLSDFLTQLTAPLRCQAPNETIIAHMNIPVYSGHVVSCPDVFMALSWYHITGSGDFPRAGDERQNDELTLEWMNGPANCFEQKFIAFFGAIVPKENIYSTGTLLKAVLTIQRRWKKFRISKEKRASPYLDEY